MIRPHATPKPLHATLTVLLFGTLIAALAARTADAQDLSSGFIVAHELPSAMSPTDTKRVVAGDFTGDFRKDICMLEGGYAYMSFGSADYSAIEAIPTSVISATVKDIAFLPRDGGPGAFLFLTTNGIEIVGYDSDDYDHEETISTGGWSSAVAIRVMDYGGTDDPDIVGLASNRKTILRIKDVDGTRVYDTSLGPVASNILELERVDWDGDGDDEIAIRRSSCVEVIGMSPTYTYTPTYAPVQIQAIAFPSAADRLAVVVENSTSTLDIDLVGQGVTTTSTYLGDFDITATASADTDRDGDGDLILVDRDTYVLPYLINRHNTVPSQPFLSTDPNAAYLVTMSTTTATDNRAVPVLEDLDNDTDADLAIVLGDDEYLVVQRNIDVLEEDRWVQISDNPNDTLLNEAEFPNQPHYLSVLLVEPRVDTIDFDGIETRLWRADSLDSPNVTLAFEDILEYAENFDTAVYTFEIDETSIPFDAVYYLEFRTVKRSSGVVTHVGPTSFFFYTPRSDDFDDLMTRAAGMPTVSGDWESLIDVEDGAYSGGAGPSPGGPGGAGGPGSGGSDDET